MGTTYWLTTYRWTRCLRRTTCWWITYKWQNVDEELVGEFVTNDQLVGAQFANQAHASVEEFVGEQIGDWKPIGEFAIAQLHFVEKPT